MSMTPLRDNVCIAIDGGGIKGLIVAQALVALEQELGGGPLIEHPQIKVLAGTSTGSIIAAAIAFGMKAADIAKVYVELGQTIFPPLVPPWLPTFVQDAAKLVDLLIQHSLYQNTKLIETLRQIIGEKTGNPDLTLGELNRRLGPDKALVLTAVNISERRTHFLKSYKSGYAEWKLWEAILASSSAPIALPVLQHDDPDGKPAYYTDGGVGSYGNPGYVAAQEAVTFRGYRPRDVSVLSFGTGWVGTDDFQRAQGVPSAWHAIEWAINAPLLLLGDAARAQSIDIIDDFGGRGLDFRRFQVALQKDIDSDAFANAETYTFMQELGTKLGKQIVNNQYAPNADPQFDPEGLYEAVESYRASRKK